MRYWQDRNKVIRNFMLLWKGIGISWLRRSEVGMNHAEIGILDSVVIVKVDKFGNFLTMPGVVSKEMIQEYPSALKNNPLIRTPFIRAIKLKAIDKQDRLCWLGAAKKITEYVKVNHLHLAWPKYQPLKI